MACRLVGLNPLSEPMRALGTNPREIISEIHTSSLKKMHLKISSVKWRQFCLDLNVLKRGKVIVSTWSVEWVLIPALNSTEE